MTKVLFDIQQNLGHAWILEPHALNKLTLQAIHKGVKQNLLYIWILLSMLTLPIGYLNV